MEEVLSFDPEEYLSCISFLIRFNALSVQYLILLIFSVFARSKLVLVRAFLFFSFLCSFATSGILCGYDTGPQSSGFETVTWVFVKFSVYGN